MGTHDTGVQRRTWLQGAKEHEHLNISVSSFSRSLSVPFSLSLPPHRCFSSCVVLILLYCTFPPWVRAGPESAGKGTVRQPQAYTISTSNLREERVCPHIKFHGNILVDSVRVSNPHLGQSPYQGDGILWLIRARSHDHLSCCGYCSCLPNQNQVKWCNGNSLPIKGGSNDIGIRVD